MGFTEDQTNTLIVLHQIGGAFSLVGSLFIIGCFYQFVGLRSFAFKLVFYMGISTFFLSFSALIGESEPWLCQLQAINMSYFELSALTWSFLIAYTLHQAFLRGNPKFQTNCIDLYHNKYLLIGWGYPIVFTIIPIFTGSYGPAGEWCWIVDDTGVDVAMRFLQFYVPLWCTMVYCVYVYVKVMKKFTAMVNGQNAPTNRLKMYPVVLVICYFWGSINRVAQAFNQGQSIFWISVLQIIFSSPIGFINACVYGLTNQVRQAVAATFSGDAVTTNI